VGSSRAARTALILAALAVMITPLHAYAEPSPADLDRQAAAAWQRLEAVVEHYDTGRESLRATQAKLAALDAQLVPLTRQLDALQRRVATIAAGMYVGAGTSPVNALLAADSPRTMLDQLTMLDHIARGNARTIAALHQTRARYDAQRRELAEVARQQADQQSTLAASKASIEAQLAQLQALRARAYGTRASRSAPALRDGYVPVFTDDPAGIAVRFAFQQLGKPYRYAAAGPDSYDCSGLVLASWRAAGVRLPHSAMLQWATVRHINRDELRPGDLVFYYRDIHHVGLYVGDGRAIDAPQPGERVTMRAVDHAPIFGYGRVG
jgi:peptidoglycan DL-endopeptidase CwlO